MTLASLEQRTVEMAEAMIANSDYTAYKLEADGTLSNKVLLARAWDVSNWLDYQRFNYVVIVQNATGKAKRGFRKEGNQYDWAKFEI